VKVIPPINIGGSGSFTRAGANATYFDSAGVSTTAPANLPRSSFNPLNLTQPPTFLQETAGTTLIVSPATMATQNVTVAASQYTLSFYGTGTITLSGVATGVLNGTPRCYA